MAARSKSKAASDDLLEDLDPGPARSRPVTKKGRSRPPSKSPTKKPGGPMRSRLNSEAGSAPGSSLGRSRPGTKGKSSGEETNDEGGRDTPKQPKTVAVRKPTKSEIERETKVLEKAEETLKLLKVQAAEKQIILDKLMAELKRMLSTFNKAKEIKNNPHETEHKEEKEVTNRALTVEMRKELLEKGPFNLIFHGVEADWIETEMDDDPEFKRDVLEQKIKTLIKDEVGIARDVGIIDCYRYTDGAPYRNAYPIVVEFKQRREKEQILWRSKDRLRKHNIIVTDDTSSRIAERARQLKEEKENKKKGIKKAKPPPSPEKALFGDLF